jgi:hypothetical protein
MTAVDARSDLPRQHVGRFGLEIDIRVTLRRSPFDAIAVGIVEPGTASIGIALRILGATEHAADAGHLLHGAECSVAARGDQHSHGPHLQDGR